jgi:hypothetical protein
LVARLTKGAAVLELGYREAPRALSDIPNRQQCDDTCTLIVRMTEEKSTGLITEGDASKYACQDIAKRTRDD